MASKDDQLSDRSDGISCVTSGENMIVYGGSVSDKVWILDMENLKWSSQECGGEVPEPRKHHSAVMYKGEMYIFGGEAYGRVDDAVFALNISGRNPFTWERLDTIGRQPQARSHHCAIVQSEYMYVMGGRNSNHPTIQSISQLYSENYYDIWRLHLPSCTWEIVETRSPLQPAMWGASVSLFRHFLLFFGGFRINTDELELSGGISDSQAPTAILNDTVYIFNTNTREWTTSSPKGTSHPCGRALQCASAYGSQMIVFGGICMDASHRPVPVNDAWKWNIATGKWDRFNFCLKNWKSARLLHGIYDNKIYVLQSLGRVYILPLRQQADWKCFDCNVEGLTRPITRQIPLRVRSDHIDSVPRHVETRFDTRRLSPPRGRQEINEEAAYRAAIRDEMRARLRDELEAERPDQIGDLQKQMVSLQSQMEELVTHMTKPKPAPVEVVERHPATPPPLTPFRNNNDSLNNIVPFHSTQRVRESTPPTPVVTSHDPILSCQVSKLVQAVSKLKTLAAPQSPASGTPTIPPQQLIHQHQQSHSLQQPFGRSNGFVPPLSPVRPSVVPQQPAGIEYQQFVPPVSPQLAYPPTVMQQTVPMTVIPQYGVGYPSQPLGHQNGFPVTAAGISPAPHRGGGMYGVGIPSAAAMSPAPISTPPAVLIPQQRYDSTSVPSASHLHQLSDRRLSQDVQKQQHISQLQQHLKVCFCLFYYVFAHTLCVFHHNLHYKQNIEESAARPFS